MIGCYDELVKHKERYERLDADGEVEYDEAALAAAWIAAFSKWLEGQASNVIFDAWQTGNL